MTAAERQDAIDGLRARYNAPFSAADKRLIRELYTDVLGKTFRVTTCQRCYHDAVMEIALFLRKQNTMEQKKYIMRAGFIIQCPIFHNGKIFTNHNITDAIAEEYMTMFPDRARFFDVNPRYVAPESAVEGTTAKPAKKKSVKQKKKEKSV